jgi:hypothetical protein
MILSLSTRVARTMGVLPFLLCLAVPTVVAQEIASNSDPVTLPDAPIPNATDQAASAQYTKPGPFAKITVKYIPAGYVAQPLTSREKLNVALRDLYRPQSLAGYVIAGGYSHLVNGQPNYGTNSAAFGQRVGAAFARDTSQAIFADALFAPLFHEDPRYYVQGPSYSLALYAISRPLLTRNDNGRSTVNGSLLLGYGSAAILTSAYYPQSNRNGTDIARTYGSSLGGAAMGFVFEEFSNDIMQLIHHRKQNP